MQHQPHIDTWGAPSRTAALARFSETVSSLEATAQSLGATFAAFRAATSRNHVVRTAPSAGRLAKPLLTRRELEILRLVADGRDNAEIAVALHFGLGTIKAHVRDILSKLGTASRTAAAVRAVRMGLI